MPLTGEYEPVAQLVPCSHFMHDHCLKPWTEIANTCPICRVSFNEVNVRPHMTGPALSSYRVEDRVQRVADHGVEIPPEEEEDNEIGLADDTALIMELVREQRIWAAAWERLDADLEEHPNYAEEEDEDEYDNYWDRQVAINNRRQRIREQRMNRRRAVAAAQAGPGRNAFDETSAAWKLPTTRPRVTFPHLEHEMSKEESDSWKMMELAEKLENSRNKRRRGSASEEALLAHMGVDTTRQEADARKFKRPRTKRDSQLPAINTRNHNGESSKVGESAKAAATVGTPTANASDGGSPPSGGIFTTILEGIGKIHDVPIVSAADVSGRDLARMRPISPDRSSITRAMSRSRSPPAIYSPTSPPSSRPNSPDSDLIRGRVFSPSSPPRTPAHSPQRSGRRRAWEFPRQPSSPPGSRMQSPNGRISSSRRQQSLSPEPGSSNSDSDQKKPRRKPSITKESKAEIANMVSAALKPLYPEKISKENYTEINKKISRKMYQLVSDGAMDKQLWKAAIAEEVERATSGFTM